MGHARSMLASMIRPGIDGRGGVRLPRGEYERRRLRTRALKRKATEHGLSPEERAELAAIMRGYLRESEVALGVTRTWPHLVG